MRTNNNRMNAFTRYKIENVRLWEYSTFKQIQDTHKTRLHFTNQHWMSSSAYKIRSYSFFLSFDFFFNQF